MALLHARDDSEDDAATSKKGMSRSSRIPSSSKNDFDLHHGRHRHPDASVKRVPGTSWFLILIKKNFLLKVTEGFLCCLTGTSTKQLVSENRNCGTWPHAQSISLYGLQKACGQTAADDRPTWPVNW